jgi:hypothetical protein
MPKAIAPEQVSLIQALAAEGKSTRAIALETGIGKSSVARYAAMQQEPKLVIGEMSIEPDAARSFLADLGTEAPPASLKTDLVPPTSKLKNNPRAAQLAESLLMDSRPRAPVKMPEPEPMPLPLLPPPPPDTAQVIAQIQMNVQNFAPLLKHITHEQPQAFLESLYKKTPDELTMLLKVIEKTRLIGNLSNQFKHMFWMSTSAVEIGTQLAGLKSQGLGDALRIQEQEINMILREMALERAESFANAQRPEIRLAFMVSTTLLSVDTMNRMKEKKPKPKPAPEEYKDL